jgi:chorismate mutase / prephenate dehydratase
LMFQVPHKPGALADVMLMFRDNGLNLTWIESFPIPNSINEYFFFVELDGHGQEPNVAKAIASLQSIAIRLSILGSYPKGT